MKKICPKCSASNEASNYYCSVCQEPLNAVAAKEGSMDTYVPAPSVGRRGYGEGTSTGTWMLILLGLNIPIVNLLMGCVFAFSSFDTTMQNFGRAILIWAAIGFPLVILLAMV